MIRLLTTEQPDLRPVPTRRRQPLYRLHESHSISWTAEGSVWRIAIETGFQCDGASNPWFLWSVTGIPPDGVHRLAALYHDYIYAHRGVLPYGHFWKDGRICEVSWTRRQTDKFFAVLLRETGVTKSRRRLMYLGVRLGGWMPWYFSGPKQPQPQLIKSHVY